MEKSDHIPNEILEVWKTRGWSLIGRRREKDGTESFSMIGPGGLYRKMTFDQIYNPPQMS